ncbi:tRNA (cytidine(34)-2'-O)-methyltransferase [Pelagibacterales bacterium SAG-MED30]|nr:tRNA (cytidine(34)-2'-O)-methyltransferase [Pelagibacterales bacterium SAG-MED30]|tara:strand:- start:508 stop:981 length:474 start_codon:yes stop_codon:yes gene_type:complete
MTHKYSQEDIKIALFEPDIPQNTGAIIRTCACLGVKLEIIGPCGFLLTDKRFKRVVMDYLNEEDIKFYQSIDDFFKEKDSQRIILMTTKASINYHFFKFKKGDTILFGRESAGVPERIHKIIKNKLKIPMEKNKRSLNISSSVAIIIAESLRQIRWI